MTSGATTASSGSLGGSEPRSATQSPTLWESNHLLSSTLECGNTDLGLHNGYQILKISRLRPSRRIHNTCICICICILRAPSPTWPIATPTSAKQSKIQFKNKLRCTLMSVHGPAIEPRSTNPELRRPPGELRYATKNFDSPAEVGLLLVC